MNLVDEIHKKNRHIVTTTCFGDIHKICLLDYLGYNKYFITDFGIVQNRDKFIPNKKGLVTKQYCPLVVLDAEYKYPWVRLEGRVTSQWFPVNMLLGWSFQPYENHVVKHFSCNYPEIFAQSVAMYNWEDTLPESKFFKEFIGAIYEG